MWRLEDGQIDVTLFSKSGRDSTDDRSPIVLAIRECSEESALSGRMWMQCILAGELSEHNDQFRDTTPFYKIRRHVPRAGRLIGCAGDPVPDPEEHLMIVFHDLLC